MPFDGTTLVGFGGLEFLGGRDNGCGAGHIDPVVAALCAFSDIVQPEDHGGKITQGIGYIG